MDIVRTLHMQPGNYVVAVSGGVDSMALLHMLVELRQRFAGKKPDIGLTVAHYDHGIRPESKEDRLLVQRVAGEHKLPFVYAEGHLGAQASEDEARRARYDFLGTVRTTARARDIVTAHHLDDAVETAVHNILRGTGRKGMSSLHSSRRIVRPLLHVPKDRLVAYAHDNNLRWNEDSTNTDLRYRRNYIRHELLPRLRRSAPQEYERLKGMVRRQHSLNQAIDGQLSAILHLQPQAHTLSRHDVIMLPHRVGLELVAHWLREHGKRQFDRRLIEKLLVAIKTARPGTIFVVDQVVTVRFGLSLASIETNPDSLTRNRAGRVQSYSV